MVEDPIGGLGFIEFALERVGSKTDFVRNEMVYIANHSTYYGILAPVDYYVRNTARGEEYVYLRVYDNTSRRARKIAIKVSALRKLREL